MIIIHSAKPLNIGNKCGVVLLNGYLSDLNDIALKILLAPLRTSESIYEESTDGIHWYIVRYSNWPFCLVIE